ncbi:fibroblast growth factor-binding protein 1 [Gastrophryne carolinensis]
MKLKIALLGVAVILVSQILIVDANKQREGKKDREKDPSQKQRGGNKEERRQQPSGPAEKERGSKGGKGSLQGKFVSKEKADCAWSVSGMGTLALNVNCTTGDSRFFCTFKGNPTACPKYAKNEKSYWKQISRALRKQKNICQDQNAVLKSKECKKGPPEAHFSYLIPNVPSVPELHSNGQPEPTPEVDIKKDDDCVENKDADENQRMAKEYCGESWGSLCFMLFSMVQSKTC